MSVEGAKPLELNTRPEKVYKTTDEIRASPAPAGNLAYVTLIIQSPRFVTGGGSGASPPNFSGDNRASTMTLGIGKNALTELSAGMYLAPGDNILKLTLTYQGKIIAISNELHIHCTPKPSATASQPK